MHAPHPSITDSAPPMVRRGGHAALITTFAVSWAIWSPIVVEAQTAGLDATPWTFLLASAGPACGAVVATLWEGGARGLAAWGRRTFSARLPWRWWLAGVGMPIAYLALAWAVTFFATGSWPDPAAFGVTDELPALAWPAVALVWVLTSGLGEEAGWRGWLPALSRRMPVFWSALVVAGVWIVWHAPMFFFNSTYRAMGPAIVGWMSALVCGSYLLAWMTVGARWSIVPVLLWHAGFDLLTAADQSAGIIAATVSTVVMTQGAVCAWLLWRRRTGPRSGPLLESREER